MTISSLPCDTISLLNATQVITSVCSVVKELVENALDAGARTVSVTLQDGGLGRITVSDDGRGMTWDDVQVVGTRAHMTSKIQDYEQVAVVDKFGFRGEALYSIVQLAERVDIVSGAEQPAEPKAAEQPVEPKAAEQPVEPKARLAVGKVGAPLGSWADEEEAAESIGAAAGSSAAGSRAAGSGAALSSAAGPATAARAGSPPLGAPGLALAAHLVAFHRGQRTQPRPTASARTRGTTISLTRLFWNVPVRRQEAMRLQKSEAKAVVSYLQGLVLCQPTVGISLVEVPFGDGEGARATATARVKARAPLLSLLSLPHHPHRGVRDVLVHLHGLGVMDGAVEVCVEQVELEAAVGRGGGGAASLSIGGFLWRGAAGAGVGARPARPPPTFLSVNGRPATVPSLARRLTSLLQEDKALGAGLGGGHRPGYVLALRLPPRYIDRNVTPDKLTLFLRDEAMLLEAIIEALRAELRDKEQGAGAPCLSQMVLPLQGKGDVRPVRPNWTGSEAPAHATRPALAQRPAFAQRPALAAGPPGPGLDFSSSPASRADGDDTAAYGAHTSSAHTPTTHTPSMHTPSTHTTSPPLPAAGLATDTVSLHRSDLSGLRVIGQFNHGFILAMTRPPASDLYILDQHACDEKARYERYRDALFKGKKVQLLLRPVDLTGLLSVSQMDVLRRARPGLEALGFRFKVDGHLGAVLWTGRPVISVAGEAVELGVTDLIELLACVAEVEAEGEEDEEDEARRAEVAVYEVAEGDVGAGGADGDDFADGAIGADMADSSLDCPPDGAPDGAPDGTLAPAFSSSPARPSRPAGSGLTRPLSAYFNRLLASKACRTSVMIGQPLRHEQMQRIVHALSQLEEPWHCPHGRPTVRYLGRVGPATSLRPEEPEATTSLRPEGPKASGAADGPELEADGAAEMDEMAALAPAFLGAPPLNALVEATGAPLDADPLMAASDNGRFCHDPLPLGAAKYMT